MSNKMKTLFSVDRDTANKFWKTRVSFLQQQYVPGKQLLFQTKKPWTVGFWCFSPSVAMKAIAGANVHSMFSLLFFFERYFLSSS